MPAPSPMLALRKLALQHPEVEEGIACPGTAMERRTIKARNKAFLFFGATDALVKLGASLDEAAALAAKEPTRYRVGSNGWVKLMFSADAPPALDVVKRWIGESYKLVSLTKPKARAPAKKPKPKPARVARKR